VDEEAGIPYSCPAQCRHSHHNDNVGWPNTNFRDPSTTPSIGPRSQPPPTTIDSW
jgi:hypothetical protein